MNLEPVSLALGHVLCEPWTDTSHVYFPNDSLVSLMAVASGGKAEVGMVGRQGMLGVSLALGVGRSPARALVQVAGTAMRMSATKFSAELKRSEPLQRAAALMTSDYLSNDSFFLTHEFLAQMLGVRRTGVSVAAARLQRRGQPDGEQVDR